MSFFLDMNDTNDFKRFVYCWVLQFTCTGHFVSTINWSVQSVCAALWRCRRKQVANVNNVFLLSLYLSSSYFSEMLHQVISHKNNRIPSTQKLRWTPILLALCYIWQNKGGSEEPHWSEQNFVSHSFLLSYFQKAIIFLFVSNLFPRSGF